ncbi:MAG: response regulator [Cyclobacteriaceae bacterium]
MRTLLIIALFTLTALAGYTQPKTPFFFHIYSNYGLSSDRATCIHQDYMGYIWIGTEKGLNRFVSYKFFEFDKYQFEVEDSTSLSHDYITSIFEDSQRNLWVGTLSGLCLYDHEKDRFIRIKDEAIDISGLTIHSIKEHESKLWIGTSHGLLVYDHELNKVVANYSISNSDMKPLQVRAIESAENKVWIGSSEGLYTVEDLILNKVENIPRVDITSLDYSDGKLHIGTKQNGLISLDHDGTIRSLTTESSPSITSNQVNDVLVLKNKEIWIATNSGLSIYREGQIEFIQYEFNNYIGLSDPEVRQIYQDESGTIWLTTPLTGISSYNEADNLFQYFGQNTSQGNKNELLDFRVLSLLPDTVTNKLWIGTRKGLSEYCPIKNEFNHYPFYPDNEGFSNQVLSIAKLSEEILWLGTEKGLFSWNVKTEKYNQLADYDAVGRINKIFTDRDGYVWLGAEESGLKKIDPKSNFLNSRKLESNTSNNFYDISNINDIIQCPDGVIWVATASGLFIVEENSSRQYPIKYNGEAFKDLLINHLTLTPDGYLWASTRRQGVIQINNSSDGDLLIADKSVGLPTNDITAVVQSEPGKNWWLSTNSGLSKLVLSPDGSFSSENFYQEDGLQGEQYTPRAGALLSGKMYFGGLNGFTLFDPLKVKIEKTPIKASIFKLTVNGKDIRPGDKTGILKKSLTTTDSIEFDTEFNNFTLEFYAVEYLRPLKVTYEYMLENYDSDWVQTDKNTVSYTSLPRGKQYVFKLRAKTTLSDWSEEEILYIYTLPYFYETTFFKFFSIFSIASIISLIIYIREKRTQKRQKRLEKLISLRTQELNRQVREKEKTAGELIVAMESANNANKAKSEFLAKISHEIRTPLNGIMGLTQIIKEKEKNKKNKDMLGLVFRSAESLKDIINDLLDVSKIEVGKLEIISEKFNLHRLIDDLTKSFKFLATEKSILLESNIDPKIPEEIGGDMLRIKQVLVNLISNAIKFTNGGFVKISLKLEEIDHNELTIKFVIEDSGIGIPKSKTKLIFSSFEQIDNGTKRKYGGTGLGLSISQQLINLMGSEIEVSSEEGVGSCFQFSLKLQKAIESADEKISTTKDLTSGNRILLVEDNPINRMVVEKILEKLKQKIDTAENGRVALEKLKDHSFDLILMDVQMPVMDGYETTEAIRSSDESFADIPIIALTAGVMEEEKQRCIDVGMNDFLSKPIESQKFNLLLSKYLNNSNLIESSN